MAGDVKFPVQVPVEEQMTPQEWASYDTDPGPWAFYSLRDGLTAGHVATDTPEGVQFRLLAEEAEAAYRVLERVSDEMLEVLPVGAWQ